MTVRLRDVVCGRRHHREVEGVHERMDAEILAARARKAQADAVIASIRARVYQRNHVAEGIAALWRQGHP
jgi:hypothetical protein